MAKRGPNPETIITNQIKSVLDLMDVEYFKHWGGVFSEKGVSDLCCTLDGGRSFYCEVKVPGKDLTEKQEAFLARFERRGALVLKATSPMRVIKFLSSHGYEPAKRLLTQFTPSPAPEIHKGSCKSSARQQPPKELPWSKETGGSFGGF